MKNLVLILFVIGGAYLGFSEIRGTDSLDSHAKSEAFSASSSSTYFGLTAFDHRHVGRQVQGQGVVQKILSDDSEGSRHQRFILHLKSGQTILIAHNIDLAPRISAISVGDSIEFNGVYAANDMGGVVHWTHHDPAGHHENGWLRHRGILFQ
ncbi:MAG: DUF3465 domain-containing protein [Oceanococcus sp.]